MKLLGVYVAVVALLAQGVVSSTISLTEASLDQALRSEYDRWIAAEQQTLFPNSRSAALTPADVFRSLTSADYVNTKSSVVCTLCNSLVRVVMSYIREGMPQDSVASVISNLCVSLGLYTEEVCSGVIGLNAPIAFYIVGNKPSLEAETICGLVLQSQPCELTNEEFNWEVEVDDGEPKQIPSVETEETVKIIQLTDLHYDPVYEVNGNPLCDAPTCCRRGQNETNTSGAVAGYWGDYNSCDAPWHAIENAMEQIVTEEQDIDLAYYTGDIVDHGVWETSRALITESIRRTFAEFHEKFGSVPVYAILGNHESNPTNVFATQNVQDEEVYTAWLYELLADIWIDYGWLPESTRSTILKGGFYTVSPKTGFRVIAMNNNVCYTYNWWLMLEPQDPSDQLKWLAETLLQAEKDGEYVHILAHMPAGAGSCQHTWGRQYRKIVNRFAHIITAEFNGHTHNDEIRVIYDLENPTKAVRVAWNGGGINTYDNVNPNYKVYTADATTYAIEDVDTWIYNLTLANETPGKNPVWYKSYSFKAEYGLEDLSLESLNDLVIRMAKDPSILVTYYGHYVKQADGQLSRGCNESCRTNLLCRIVTAVTSDPTQCVYFSNLG